MEPISETTSLPQTSKKGKTRSRNDQRWELMRDDIFQIYMAQDNTLAATMLLIETMYNFKRSERKWKDKLKEWNFVKNLSKAEMKIVVAKSERRATEDGKDTMFLHHGNYIHPDKVNNWKRRLSLMAGSPLNPYAKTPVAIAYFTPRLRHPGELDACHVDVNTEAGSDSLRPVLRFHINDCFVVTEDPRPLDSRELEILLAGYRYVKPTTHEQALEYLQLQVDQDGKTYRFEPAYIRELATTHSDKPILYGKLGLGLAHRLLVDQLGRALVRNQDAEKATSLTRVMAFSAVEQNKLLGSWHYDEGLYRQSLPFLQSALEYCLTEDIYSEVEPLADMLDNVYSQLAPLGSGKLVESSLTSELRATVLTSLRRNTNNADFDSCRRYFQFLQPRLRTFSRHIMYPDQITLIYKYLDDLIGAQLHILGAHCEDYRAQRLRSSCNACQNLLQSSIQHIDELLQDQDFASEHDALGRLSSSMRLIVSNLILDGSWDI